MQIHFNYYSAQIKKKTIINISNNYKTKKTIRQKTNKKILTYFQNLWFLAKYKVLYIVLKNLR